MERPTCGDCPYWDHTEDGLGACLRYAPKICNPPDDEAYPFNGSWPQTYKWHWCGEHPNFPAYIRSLKAVPPAEGSQDDKIDFWSWGAHERKVVHKMKIETWSQLANLTTKALSAQYGCGATTLAIILDKLRARGLYLRTDGQGEPQ